ncbi:MAG: hypothetical protein R3F38_08800 [Gammaproteobacteria bacterium]
MRALLLLALSGLIIACGQKGPLTCPMPSLHRRTPAPPVPQ